MGLQGRKRREKGGLPMIFWLKTQRKRGGGELAKKVAERMLLTCGVLGPFFSTSSRLFQNPFQKSLFGSFIPSFGPKARNLICNRSTGLPLKSALPQAGHSRNLADQITCAPKLRRPAFQRGLQAMSTTHPRTLPSDTK